MFSHAQRTCVHQIGFHYQSEPRPSRHTSTMGQTAPTLPNRWTDGCPVLLDRRRFRPCVLSVETTTPRRRDNNLSERTLRALALGRNNWGVIGSEKGGKTAAVLYSVVETRKHLGIDPFTYMREALAGDFRLGEKPTGEQQMEWLPDRWSISRGRDSPVKSADV